MTNDFIEKVSDVFASFLWSKDLSTEFNEGKFGYVIETNKFTIDFMAEFSCDIQMDGDGYLTPSLEVSKNCESRLYQISVSDNETEEYFFEEENCVELGDLYCAISDILQEVAKSYEN